MTVLGIVLGFSAAIFQGASYLFSRQYTLKNRGSLLDLLVFSHIVMGILGGLATLLLKVTLLRDTPLPGIGEYIVPMLLSLLFFLLAQICLFIALAEAPASRVAPLLGVKIVILVLISILFLGERYSLYQWLGVGLNLTAAILLLNLGGLPSRRMILSVLGAALGYSLSDIFIRETILRVSDLGPVLASAVSTGITYLLAGLISLVFLIFMKKPKLSRFTHSFGYGFFWILGMYCLFGCFAILNVVFGNILQSTRGIFNILFGALLAKLGHSVLEEKAETSLIVKRIVAGLLMTAAIALFGLG